MAKVNDFALFLGKICEKYMGLWAGGRGILFHKVSFPSDSHLTSGEEPGVRASYSCSLLDMRLFPPRKVLPGCKSENQYINGLVSLTKHEKICQTKVG
jgi:hypothetical protein